MILAAHAGKSFTGVSAVDLLAPYETKRRAQQEALCDVLSGSYTIGVGFEDLLCASADDGLQSILPLDVVRLERGDTLMVVGCSYIFSADKGASIDERFAIAEGSVTFDVIEALPGNTPVDSSDQEPAPGG